MDAWVNKCLKNGIGDSVKRMARFHKQRLEYDFLKISGELSTIDDQVGCDQVRKVYSASERVTKLNELAIRASNRRRKITNFLLAVQNAELGKFKINAYEFHSTHAMLVNLSTELGKLKKIQSEIADMLYTKQVYPANTETLCQSSVVSTPKTKMPRLDCPNTGSVLKNALFAHIEGKSPAARKKEAAEFYVE